MAIRKRKWLSNGQEKVGWIADFRDPTGARQKKQFPTKAQATEYLSKADFAIREGTFRKSAEKMTVEQVAKQYLEHLKGRYKRGENVTIRRTDEEEEAAAAAANAEAFFEKPAAEGEAEVEATGEEAAAEK
mgnify:CR=1 FL=1